MLCRLRVSQRLSCSTARPRLRTVRSRNAKEPLVAAADPDSLFGKARTTRDYGITVFSETGLERTLNTRALSSDDNSKQ